MSTFKLADYGTERTAEDCYVTCKRTDCNVWLIDEFGSGWSLADIVAIAQEHYNTHHREPHLERNGQ